MSEELKPCPFCGGEATTWIDRLGNGNDMYKTGCRGDDCLMRPAISCAKPDYTEVAWNTRAPAWQDISTAPKDGTVFDVWCVKRDGYTNYPARIANCRYNKGVLEYLHSHGWFALKGGWEGREVIITHWMSLPEPPTAQTEGE